MGWSGDQAGQGVQSGWGGQVAWAAEVVGLVRVDWVVRVVRDVKLDVMHSEKYMVCKKEREKLRCRAYYINIHIAQTYM